MGRNATCAVADPSQRDAQMEKKRIQPKKNIKETEKITPAEVM